MQTSPNVSLSVYTIYLEIRQNSQEIKILLMFLPVALGGHLLKASSPEGVRLHTIDTA